MADGTIWDINSTGAEFGPKCLHLLGIHYLTVSDTTSYLYGKDNVSALKTLRAVDFPGLSTAFGELDVMREHAMEAWLEFICDPRGQRREITTDDARYRLLLCAQLRLASFSNSYAPTSN